MLKVFTIDAHVTRDGNERLHGVKEIVLKAGIERKHYIC
jgi:hypothetical protein